MRTVSGRLSRVNVRATADSAFWGDEYDASVYLWQGAVHMLTLSEWDSINVPCLEDRFATKGQSAAAHEYCKKVFLELLPVLASRLNDLHRVDLSPVQWRTAFGYWLFRHICIAYEKYVYLSTLNVEETSLRLLATESFFVPNDHYDYYECFCNDFGVQQLVSQYYYCFAKRSFPSVVKKYEGIPPPLPDDHLRGVVLARPVRAASGPGEPWRRLLAARARAGLRRTARFLRILLSSPRVKDDGSGGLQGSDPEIAVCGIDDTSGLLAILAQRGQDRIGTIALPKVEVEKKPADRAGRKRLCDFAEGSGFKSYLSRTLEYCFPKILVEYFRAYFDAFCVDIDERVFSHFASEWWISCFPISIYAAIAKMKGRRLVLRQHGASTQWLSSNLCWLEYDVADVYITTGWNSDKGNMTQGGFRDVPRYAFGTDKRRILYAGCARCPYLLEFGEVATNTSYTRLLRRMSSFVDQLPPRLREHFVLRARRIRAFWDAEHALEVKKRNIAVDTGPFVESLAASRIVVIDHLSTGVAEALLMGVPCLILCYEDIEPLADEYRSLFDDLRACGVVHGSVASAVKHLASIYDDVEGWWKQEQVRQAVQAVVSTTLRPFSSTVDCLVSLLDSGGARACRREAASNLPNSPRARGT